MARNLAISSKIDVVSNPKQESA